MKQFTVITTVGTVWRYPAKSIQDLTRQMRAQGLKWLAIHEDKETTKS